MLNNQHLKDTILFADLSNQEIDGLALLSRRLNIARSEAVFMQGDPSNAIFILQKGIVKISRVNTDGRKLTIDLIESGQFFGELCLAGEKERRSFAEAMMDSVCCAIDKDHFEGFLRKRPDFALTLIKILGDRRLAMENLLEDMAFMEIPARVIALLLKYADKNIVRISLTHQEIADLTGSTRVSVSRCIAKLRKDGLIQTTSDRIILSDEAAQLSQINCSARYA